MKLKSFQVTNFQSVLDSAVIEVADITCLVGKNEAGKSALLKALYRLNPIRAEDVNFSVTNDYPRLEVMDYEAEVQSKKREPAKAIEATYILDDEVPEIEKVFGPKFLVNNEVTITKYYENTRKYTLFVREVEAIKYMSRNLTGDIKTAAEKTTTAKDLATILEAHAADPAVAAILPVVQAAKDHEFSHYAFNEIIRKHEPKYLYFDEYYQMRGCENIEALQNRLSQNQLLPSDHPLLGLIELARLDLPQILNPNSTQDLKNKLEGAGNHLTRQILPYWSQNKHLQMRFDVRPARPGDPEGMRGGTNIWGEVYDTRHFVSTSLGTRSRGFVWFFSFVAWYSQVKRKGENVLLLLDEPGLTLHGRAQGDLLRYFEQEVKGKHQLIYTTHSPFMVDPARFDRVRIVQDLSIDQENLPHDKQGTKVTRDIFEANDDSLFPLQGAFGYEIHQTLFIGPNSLLVEGPADLLFIQGMTSVLAREGREGLSDEWTMTPVGGSGRVPTFVRLLTGQKGMKIATLIDIQKKDKKIIEGLYKDKLLKKANVRTFGDYTGEAEADIEDMFDEGFYLELFNAEYAKEIGGTVSSADLTSKEPRILQRIDGWREKSGKPPNFSHYRPARLFHENLNKLAPKISSATKDRFEKAFKELNALLK